MFGIDFNLEMTHYIAIGVVCALALVYFLLEHFVWRRVKEQREGWIRTAFKRFKRPVQFLFFLTTAIIVMQSVIDNLDDQVWYQKIYAISVITTLSWMGVKAIGLISDIFLGRFDVSAYENFKARQVYTQVRVMRRFLITMIVFIGIACCLMVFEQIRALGVSLIASAGVGAIVLGLAAQKTLGNFFTGLQIAFTQPIRIGDAVIVEGEWGTIEEINLTYVVVKIWDLRRLILPIAYFVDNPFQNWTRHSANLLGPVILHLDYATPVEALRKELDRLCEEDEDVKRLWDGQVKGVQVVETNSKTMEVRVLVSAPNAGMAWDLRCLVRERLIAFIQENYPHCLPVMRTDISPLEIEAADQKEAA